MRQRVIHWSLVAIIVITTSIMIGEVAKDESSTAGFGLLVTVWAQLITVSVAIGVDRAFSRRQARETIRET